MLGKRNRHLFVLLSLIAVTVFIGVLHGVSVEATDTISISSLAGFWTASSGTGTATIEIEVEETLDLVLKAGVGGIRFSNISGDDGMNIFLIIVCAAAINSMSFITGSSR